MLWIRVSSLGEVVGCFFCVFFEVGRVYPGERRERGVRLVVVAGGSVRCQAEAKFRQVSKEQLEP